MTTIKTLVLSICIALCFTAVTPAGLEDEISYIRQTKITIYGHTGQDPVYKSTVGKDGFFIPTKTNPKLKAFVIEDDPFSNSVINALDIESIGLSQPLEPTDNMLPSPYLNEMHSGFGFSWQHTNGFGGAIPAPPAFILLISGFLISARRRP
ncbi:MAG: hypothetical protein H8E86_02090 [Planctomycetes bacterium]|nr:hypothetical protein [Planctomycetota bacterium]